MRILFTLLILACTVMSGVAFAADPPANVLEHACTLGDLIGHTWKMVKMSESPRRKEWNLFHTAPFEYLTFYDSVQYGYLDSNTELKPDVLQYNMQSWPRAGKHVLQYRLVEGGVLDLYLDKKVKYRYRCTYVVKSHDEFVKGDIKLNGYSTQFKKGTLYKLYRFWY